MTQTEQITVALKQVLKTRGITYAELTQRIGLSEVSAKRLSSHGPLTLGRLDQICGVLETDLFDLAKIGRYRAEAVSELSLEQGATPARDPRLSQARPACNV